MNSIIRAFENGKAFIPFITAGDPSIEVTEELILTMAEAGADIIEIGIPFSDPIAEGPVIQAADYRALEAGTTTDLIFDMVTRIRRKCSTPLVFMTYVNPIFTYGVEHFMKQCRSTGIAAVIVPDLPFEERVEIKSYCERYGIILISMIAPTSKERIAKIAREAEGFIYCVSSLGVTGMRTEINNDAKEIIRQVKEIKDIPCAIGFGISTPAQAAQMAEFSDGVIVGSAIVKLVEQYGTACIPHVEEYVRNMKKAVR